MNDIILGGPPIPLYEIDDLTVSLPEFHNQIYDIFNLLSSQYEISDDKIMYAYDAFIKATGYHQTFLENNANVIKDAQIALTDVITLYVSLLIGITLVIIIWAFCLLGLYDWITALILTFVIIFFIFILSFAYRSKSERIINEEASRLKTESQQSLENFKNSIPHWPKGLYNALLAIIEEPKEELNPDEHFDEPKPDEPKSVIKKGCGCRD